MGFSRQEYWSVLPSTPPGDLPNPRSNPRLLCLLHWQAGSLSLVSPGKPMPKALPTVTPEIVPPSVSPSVCPHTGGLRPNHRNSCCLRKSHKPLLTPALSQDREPGTQRKLSRSFSRLGPMRPWAKPHGRNELSPARGARPAPQGRDPGHVVGSVHGKRHLCNVCLARGLWGHSERRGTRALPGDTQAPMRGSLWGFSNTESLAVFHPSFPRLMHRGNHFFPHHRDVSQEPTRHKHVQKTAGPCSVVVQNLPEWFMVGFSLLGMPAHSGRLTASNWKHRKPPKSVPKHIPPNSDASWPSLSLVRPLLFGAVQLGKEACISTMADAFSRKNGERWQIKGNLKWQLRVTRAYHRIPWFFSIKLTCPLCRLFNLDGF